MACGAARCITIIGIPWGVQCFKFASISFFPFKKDIEFGGGAVSFLANLLWLVFFGWWMAIENVCFGLLWCVTIIGIPWGMQFFKIAKLSLLPFGAKVADIS